MRTVHTRGYNNSYVRCYRIGLVNQAKHLENTGRLERFSDIERTVNLHSGKRVNGIKAMMFVRRTDLPLHLQGILEQQADFQTLCQAIAFTTPLYQLNKSGNRLPVSPADHGNCTLAHSPGFPVTKPGPEVIQHKAESFSDLELRGFLGDFQALKGSLIVMNLRGHEGKPITQEDFLRTAIQLARQLA